MTKAGWNKERNWKVNERNGGFNIEEIKPKNEEENEEQEFWGDSGMINPRDTWGSSRGGLPWPAGNLAILETLSSPK